MPQLPPLKAVSAFEATVRCGSVAAASDELHVTPAAVSQQLRKLQEILGLPLFERRSRSLTATPAARELAAELTNSFRSIADAFKRHAHAANTRNLQVLTLPSLAAKLVVPALTELSTLHPSLRVSFAYVHRPSDFILKDADVLLCIADAETPPRNKTLKLLGGYVRPVCAPRYLEKIGRQAVGPADLVALDLLHDMDLTAWNAWFRKANIAASKLRPGNVFEDFGLLSSAVLAGQGVALCPVELFAEELARGDLVQLSQIAVHEDRVYCAMIGDNASSEALIFCAWLGAVVAKFRESHASAIEWLPSVE